MFRPIGALSNLLRLCALAGVLAALSACAATIPTVRMARDGGIQRIGDSAIGNYLAGRQAGLEQDTSTAAKYFNRALAADPDNPTLLERTFLLDVAAGDVAEGAVLARKVAATSPDNRVARLILIIDAIKEGHNAEVIKELDAGDKNESDIILTTIRAWADAGLGKTDEALAVLRTDDVKNALGAFGDFHDALILDYAGRDKEAEAAYAAAVTASQGRSVRVLEAFGNFLTREHKNDQAIKLYETYLSLVPGHPVIAAALARAQTGKRPAPRLVSSPAEGVAEALYGVAVVLAGEQSVDLPIVYTQLALYLRPSLSPGYALLGDLYEQQENWEKAVEAFGKIPANADVAELAAVSIARDMSRMNKTDEAIATLRDWAKQDPASVDVQVTLGDLYRAQEKWDLAAAAYDAALKSMPSDDDQRWQIIYAKGISLERGGHWDKAEPLLQQALKLKPDQPQILNYLGYSWIDRGEKLKEALSLIDKAVKQRPDDGYVVDSLGWAYYRLGDYQTAVYYLEHAVELKADDPTINDHLGDAYWRIGRRLEARFQWSHALSYNPSADEAKQLKAKLEDGLADVRSSATVLKPTRTAASK